MSSTGNSSIPFVSGARAPAGHYEEFLANPARFMLRAWQECGELAEFDLGGARNVLMVGVDAHEAVFRAPDDQLSAAEPYQYMVPVFGEGIQYGAPLE
ncbi:MAG: cytochrome P450, partial [Myxococcota bacterium]